MERPASHLALRVTDRGGRQWHADVGFGLPGFGLGPDGGAVGLG